jgi:hypothetical protein
MIDTRLSPVGASLTPHSRSTGRSVRRIEAVANREALGQLVLTFRLEGDIGDLFLPARRPPSPTDELWRRTCFETFIRPGSARAYYEFNLSPSSEWAAYGFEDRRSGMRPITIPPPETTSSQDADTFTLRASLDLSTVPDLAAALPWRVNIAAVTEDLSGAHTWWALFHPAETPDFHHPDAFTLLLPFPAPDTVP